MRRWHEVKKRKKASDIHRETNYVFAKRASFEKAFPEIKIFKIEVQTKSEGRGYDFEYFI